MKNRQVPDIEPGGEISGEMKINETYVKIYAST